MGLLSKVIAIASSLMEEALMVLESKVCPVFLIVGSKHHSASRPLYPMLMAEECDVLDGVSQPMDEVQTERSYVTYTGESTQLARLSSMNVMRPARSRPTPRRRLFINRYHLSPHGDEMVLYSSPDS